MTNVQETTSLREQKWEKRVVIFKGSNEELSAKVALLAQNKAEIAERRLLIFAVSDGKTLLFDERGEFSETSLVSVQEATSRLRDQNCILIGLDGGIKEVYGDLALTQIFADIDGMPMRRAER